MTLTHWSETTCAIDMAPYSSFYQSIVKNILAENQGRQTVVVEAGVRFGCSARILADSLKDCDDWKLHLIDPVPTTEALQVVEAYPQNVTFYTDLAEWAASKFESRSVDLLHIDADVRGDHPYEMALQILLAFWSKLKPNGSIILHDCTAAFPTIQRLANELKSSGQWKATHARPRKDCPISAPCLLKRSPGGLILDDLTVVVPVIKDEYLRSLLEDLQSGSLKPTEVIVIDNSGTQVAKLICSRFPDLPIRYLPQKQNLGVNASWNLGLKEARTELVSILNDDLVLPTGFIESLRGVFQSYPLAGFVVPQTTTNPARVVTTSSGLPNVTMQPHREGWAYTVRKSAVRPIPDSLFTFFGDDFFFHCVQKKGLWCLKIADTLIFHHVGISQNIPERERLKLPSLQHDQAAWRSVQARL